MKPTYAFQICSLHNGVDNYTLCSDGILRGGYICLGKKGDTLLYRRKSAALKKLAEFKRYRPKLNHNSTHREYNYVSETSTMIYGSGEPFYTVRELDENGNCLKEYKNDVCGNIVS